MDFKAALASTSGDVETNLRSFFQEQHALASEVDVHIAQSVKLLEEFSLRGGKYIRPFLVRLGAELAGGSFTDCLDIASAVELHHKHILILDDISDRDETRYGGPTLEYRYIELFGNTKNDKHRALSFAMLDAVFLGSLSRELLFTSPVSPEVTKKCLQILGRTMFRDTLAGWQIHGLQANQPLSMAKEDEFVKGLLLVTAKYTFEGPLCIGLTIAGNSDTKLEESLQTYARSVGTAFQIQDDILGLFGKTEETGKPVGNDVREGKKTLLLQYAYKQSSASDQEFLERVCGSQLTSSDLERVQEIVTATGSLKYSQDLAKDFVKKGISAITHLASSPAKQHLLDLAHYIIDRKS